uniref:Myb-like domain-containing protein n=1 Tax=Oryzias sinensis TaxID=183150 RepID=A0A8C7XJV9_9TELE
MASYNLLQRAYSNFESPAKVFAQLKSKVQKEAKSTTKECKSGFHSPKKKTSLWTGELTDTQGFDSGLNEAHALTLSPITSPQKTFDCPGSDESGKPLDMTFTQKAKDSLFLESTAMSHTLVNRCQTAERGRPIRGLDCLGSYRSPVETAGRDTRDNKRAPPVVIGCSPNTMFSPMRNRKRKLEQHEFGKVSGMTEESQQDQHLKMDGKSSAVGDGRGRGDGGGGCTNQPEMLRDHMFTPRTKVQKHCSIAIERLPIMSPAKMFAFMKERENQLQKLEAGINNSRRDLFGNLHQTQDIPLPSAENQMETTPRRHIPAQESVGNRSDSQLDSSRSACSQRMSTSPAPVLPEDPLVLNSPQISIPKKCETKFGLRHWPSQRKFPVENVVYLKKWFPRRSSNGLFVDGIHREDNIPWHSNIIAERVSKSALRTVSGRVYFLVGRMIPNVTSDFPKWFLKKFANGFPSDWKALYEKFLSESKEEKKKKTDNTGIQPTKKPEAASVNCSARKMRQRALKTPDVSPQLLSASTKVSRSGRVIKPPLEYWRGGRVLLDAEMNVTIHECYDSILSDSMAESQEPVRDFLPRSKGKKCSHLATVEEVSVPVRKVKLLQKQGKNGPKSGKFPDSSDAAVETCSSTEDGSRRTTRSSQKCKHLSTTGSHKEALKESEPKRPKQRQIKQTGNTDMSPTGKARRRRTVLANFNSSESLTTDGQFSFEEKKPKKKRQGRKVPQKPEQNHSLSSNQSQSSEENLKKSRKTNHRRRRNRKAHEQQRWVKVPPTVNPLPTQTSKKHQVQKPILDEDEWTEEELSRLQEVVSYYPKHIAGYWEKVARRVGTRTAEECHKKHTSHGTSQSPAKTHRRQKKGKAEAAKHPAAEQPVISARAGTLKRKQQVRHFLETLPKDDMNDAFSSTYMRNKRFEVPSLCSSDDHDSMLADLEYQTPKSNCFPEVKTPQCLHITPGMMGSPNTKSDDKYVYQLQRRMKKNQFNVQKNPAPSKKFIATPGVKRVMRRCGETENTSFVVWEMFPGKEEESPESGEEEDYYFSDD